MQDEELAKLIVDQETDDDENAPHRPPLTEYDSRYILGVEMHSVLQEIAAALVAQASGGKTKRAPKPLPAPDTAVARERDRRYVDHNRGIMQQIVPWDA